MSDWKAVPEMVIREGHSKRRWCVVDLDACTIVADNLSEENAMLFAVAPELHEHLASFVGAFDLGSPLSRREISEARQSVRRSGQ